MGMRKNTTKLTKKIEAKDKLKNARKREQYNDEKKNQILGKED